MSTPEPSKIATIESTLKYFRVTSYVTGIFLLLIMALWVIRLTSQQELWAFGPEGFLSLAQYTLDADDFKVGLPTEGFSITSSALIVHGWLYVAYLFGDFRLWTLLSWSFFRFLMIAAGGVIPFLSFFTERHYTKVAQAELVAMKSEAKK